MIRADHRRGNGTPRASAPRDGRVGAGRVRFDARHVAAGRTDDPETMGWDGSGVDENRGYTDPVTDEAKRILEAAMRLPDAERAALAVVLKDSIGDGSATEDIEAAWLEESERRREELRSGQAKTVSWQEVRREMFEMIERARAGESDRARQAAG